MQNPILGTTNRIIFLILFLACLVLLMFSYYDTIKFVNYEVFCTTEETSEETNTSSIDNYFIETRFLVNNPKCKMVNLHPFNKDAKKYFKPQKYKSCRTKELLTYVTRSDNISTLHIDLQILPSYSKTEVTCCYSNITRKNNKKSPDSGITISECENFSGELMMANDVVLVKCKSDGNLVYENAHVTLNLKESVKQKMVARTNATRPISVLFVGIDSISRLNFIRSLPNTYKYVEDNDWLSLMGYNKMDDNTFPNLMAILTGYNQSYAYAQCNPKSVGMLDKCPLLWYDFRKFGYITAYAEDEASISTFNYRKKGFSEPPTDYYFRSYVMATEKLEKKSKDGMTYCTGPETAGERIMNVAKDFAITFNRYPHFGFFWMNSFSHNQLNSPTGMDNKVKLFLEDLENGNVTNNSVIIFLSDHGMRFGPIRLTETGWLEERLPFIYVSLPPWFKKEFPLEYENFRSNAHKLTTPYDLHMTLQHILVLSGFNYTVIPSNACPKCKSLFEEVDFERSCEDAGITQHWCTCAGYNEITLDKTAETMVTDYLLNEIYKITSNASRLSNGEEKCAKYKLGAVLSTSISQKMSYNNSTYILIKIETVPKAVFEATLVVNGEVAKGSYSSSGEISRLDFYSDHSHCVDDAFLKKYCYCR